MANELLGRDLLLSDNYDLQFSNNNDFQFVSFEANLRQALLSRILTKIGELSAIPEYGSNIPNLIGEPASILLNKEAEGYVSEVLLKDPRVDSFSNLDIEFIGNSLFISVDVKPIQSQNVLNLVFNINL